MLALLMLFSTAALSGCQEKNTDVERDRGVEVDAPGTDVKVKPRDVDVDAPGVDVKVRPKDEGGVDVDVD
jgi:hypothetical protein